MPLLAQARPHSRIQAMHRLSCPLPPQPPRANLSLRTSLVFASLHLHKVSLAATLVIKGANMKQSQNFSESESAALSPEEREQALRIERAVDDFLADSRSIRYVATDENQASLLKFLADHSLQVTHANLLFAYNSLCADGALELSRSRPPLKGRPRQPQHNHQPRSRPHRTSERRRCSGMGGRFHTRTRGPYEPTRG